MSERFKIGDTAYVSHFGSRQFNIDCPVCFRKGCIHVILGDGTSVEMPCEYCTDGLGTSPKGYVTEYRRDAGTKAVVIDKVRINQTADGEEIEYQAHSYLYNPDNLFSTEEEAFADSERRAAEHNLELETKAENVKGKPNKNYSWNVGYHMRLAKKAEIDMAYHTKMAKICKCRAKEIV